MQHLFTAAPTAQRSPRALGPFASAPCAISGTAVPPPDGCCASQLPLGDTPLCFGSPVLREGRASTSPPSPGAAPAAAPSMGKRWDEFVVNWPRRRCILGYEQFGEELRGCPSAVSGDNSRAALQERPGNLRICIWDPGICGGVGCARGLVPMGSRDPAAPRGEVA